MNRTLWLFRTTDGFRNRLSTLLPCFQTGQSSWNCTNTTTPQTCHAPVKHYRLILGGVRCTRNTAPCEAKPLSRRILYLIVSNSIPLAPKGIEPFSLSIDRGMYFRCTRRPDLVGRLGIEPSSER